MKIYYEIANSFEMQKQDILEELSNRFKTQQESQKIIIQCLFNLNTLMQDINQPDILNELSIILKQLKNNLDMIKNVLSTLTDLQKYMSSFESSNINMESIQNYNNIIYNFEKLYYQSISDVNTFIYEYLEFISSVKIQKHSIITEKQNESHVSSEILEDNKTLLISEIQNKVFLPYSISDLKEILDTCPYYSNFEEIINKEYTIPLDYYKNSIISRFRETFNLMRKKENASITDSLDLALELSFNSLLNPAIISACKNLDELDVYLDCLNSNELDKFTLFDIKYEMFPQ